MIPVSLRKIRVRFLLPLISLSLISVPLSAQSAARISQPIDSNSLLRVSGSTHPLATAANDLGRAAADLPLERMLLVLKPSAEQQAAMAKLIDDLHNPDSARYHQWLMPEEFGAKFGPADEDVAKVTGWLQQQGFRVSAVGRGKQYIEFSGSARQVENAFHTEMHNYLVNGERHIANSVDISLPQAMTPVAQGVLSLHDFRKKAAHSQFHRVSRNPATGQLVPDFTISTAQGSAHFMVPGDFARIYNTEPLLKQRISGAGVSIAIVGRSNINLSDVETFRKIFGLPANDPIFIINGEDPGIGEEEGEADIDVEWSGAVAPEATIKFVISGSSVTTDGVDLSLVYVIDNVVAPIMSSSFSSCEVFLGTAGNLFFSNLYEQAAAEGITAFSSTGDFGPAACPNQESASPATLAGISGLASTPFETAVGGTQFAENGLDGIYWLANNRPDQSSAVGYIPETVWNESCDPTVDPHKCGGTDAFFMIAGSGGPSSCIQSSIVNGQFVCKAGYPKPSWQAGPGVPNDGVRDIPDLSLDAGGAHDGFLVCNEGSCQTIEANGQTFIANASVVGGTSVSAPSMAGIMALIEQKNGLFEGLANFNFYKLAAENKLASCNSTNLTTPTKSSSCFFHDVTTGTNAVPDVPGYPAQPGYDMSTGVGTVNAANVVAGWNVAPKLTTTTSLSSGPIAAQHGQPVPIKVTVQPTSGAGAPSGEVDLISDKFGSVLGGALTNGNLKTHAVDLPGGQYKLSAQYSGDAMFSSSTSGGVAVNITPEPAVVNAHAFELNFVGGIKPVFGPLLYSQPTGLQIQVTGRSGKGAVTGTFTLMDGATNLGTFALPETGSTFLEVDGLPANTGMVPGKHSFTVAYNGDNSFQPAVSNPVNVTVIKKPTDTQVAPLSTTAVVGEPLELALLVDAKGPSGFAPGVELPSGTVRIFDNGKAISPGIPLVLNGPFGAGTAQAVFITSSLAAGTHSLSLGYSGDANYGAVSSSDFVNAPSIQVQINPPNGAIPKITLQQLPGTIKLGQTVNYVVTVRPPAGNGPMPTGTVSIVGPVDNVLVGPQPLINGNATLILSFAAAGQFPLVASYLGDINYSGFISAILNTQVNPGTPTVTLRAASPEVAANTQTSLTVNVVGAPQNPIIPQNPFATPTGSVQFFDSVNEAAEQPLGPPDFLTIGNGGNPIFTLPTVLPPGLNLITVQYSGDSNWAPRTSNAVSVVVK
jgi:hypothetical protein